MKASDIVLILSAVGALVTVISTAIISIMKIEKVKADLQRDVQDVKHTLRDDVQSVHKIVNQQRTDMLTYQADLIRALRREGIDVPRDESEYP